MVDNLMAKAWTLEFWLCHYYHKQSLGDYGQNKLAKLMP
jgi:hypothetical protein